MKPMRGMLMLLLLDMAQLVEMTIIMNLLMNGLTQARVLFKMETGLVGSQIIGMKKLLYLR